MKKLEVSDKVYLKSHARHGNNTYYRFETVARLTKTQAILSNGVKVINEPTKGYYDKDFGYSTYGEQWEKWFIVTHEILEEAAKEKERQTANNWFKTHEFTDEEKIAVYNLFKTN